MDILGGGSNKPLVYRMFGVKGEGIRGVTFQSHGNDVLGRNVWLRCQALSAEVAAMLASAEERDALAPWVILA